MRHVRCSLIFAGLLVLLGAHTALALDPGKHLTQYSRRHFGEEHGLPQLSVFALAQTHDGYLWVGTDLGLARFDGASFTVFDGKATKILSNAIRSLAVDKAGDLWVGTAGGVGLGRYGNGVWGPMGRGTPFEGKTDGVFDGVLASFVDAGGNPWFGTKHWWITHRDGKFVELDYAGGVPASGAEDGNGVHWFASTLGLYQLARGGATFTKTTAPGFDLVDVKTVLITPDGTLWAGGQGGFASVAGPGAGKHFATGKSGLPGKKVKLLYRDRDGNIWCGTDEGLARFRDGAFETFLPGDPLATESILAIQEDREGNLWVGTRSSGLHQLISGKFLTISTNEGLPRNNATGVWGASDGTVWIATYDGGLASYKEGKLRTYSTKDGLCTNRLTALSEWPDGTLWIGGEGETPICRMKDGKFDTFTEARGLPPKNKRNVRTLARADRRGTVWIGTGYLLRVEGDRLVEEKIPLPNPGTQTGPILGLHEDRQGALWVGRMKALLRFADGKWTEYGDGAPGMPASPVESFRDDVAGRLWMGTFRSLARFSGGEQGTFKFFGRDIGLIDDAVFQILEDGKDNLWLSSARGIFRVAKADLEAIDRGLARSIPVRHFGSWDGMRTSRSEGNVNPAGARARDGRLWFPGHMGVAAIDPAHLGDGLTPPPVYIEKVSAGGQDVDIKFTAVSFTAPERMRFKYKLSPFDHDWRQSAGQERRASYTNLPAGRYTFHVIAGNSDGVWNQTGATADVLIKKR